MAGPIDAYARAVTDAPGTSLGERQLALGRLFGGYRATLALHAAVKCGLADALAQGPRSVVDVAADTGATVDGVRRLLRYLAGLGLCEEHAPSMFGLTPLGELLRADVEGSMRAPILVGAELELPAWQHLVAGIRDGSSPFVAAHGARYFDHLGRPENAAMARLFDAFMSTLTLSHGAAFIEAYDLTGARCVVDVGAGDATLLVLLLRSRPELRGIGFDLPDVIEAARRSLPADVAPRCSLVGGDFFAAVPKGGDVYLLKRILHDWEDGEVLQILRRCREAMPSDGRLAILERLVPDGLAGASVELAAAAEFDLHMLAGPGGRERTRAEFEALLGSAGFRLTEVTPTRWGQWAIEALPAE